MRGRLSSLRRKLPEDGGLTRKLAAGNALRRKKRGGLEPFGPYTI